MYITTGQLTIVIRKIINQKKCIEMEDAVGDLEVYDYSSQMTMSVIHFWSYSHNLPNNYLITNNRISIECVCNYAIFNLLMFIFHIIHINIKLSYLPNRSKINHIPLQ